MAKWKVTVLWRLPICFLLVIFLNGPTPAPSPLFSVFSKKRYNFNNRSMWKMSCPSSVWCQESNPWPLDLSRLPPPLDQGSCWSSEGGKFSTYSSLLGLGTKKWSESCFLNGPTPASIFVVFKHKNITEKTVSFSEIRTRTVGVKGKHVNHLTTTTTAKWPEFFCLQKLEIIIYNFRRGQFWSDFGGAEGKALTTLTTLTLMGTFRLKWMRRWTSIFLCPKWLLCRDDLPTGWSM